MTRHDCRNSTYARGYTVNRGFVVAWRKIIKFPGLKKNSQGFLIELYLLGKERKDHQTTFVNWRRL